MSEILAIDDLAAAVDRAAEKIEAGVPVALPTDTVYVLAGDPTDPGVTDRLFHLKHRSRAYDLSVLVGSIDQAMELTTAVPAAAKLLMERFWPGAMTLVLPRNPDQALDLGDDDVTIGLRLAKHPVPSTLCLEVGPLAATPAGVQGEVVFETAPEVAAEFGAWVPLILDGGRCGGAAATVVDATGEEPRLLREGALAWADIEAAL